jgi:NAD(P)-dependent dehydrogenase (short-subunit alcohol dehydrogenase family)
MGKGVILVTGASSGIGRACALRFAELGYRVLAGVRKEADGEALRNEGPKGIDPVSLDVTRAESIAEAVTAVGDQPLAGLINNAGVATMGPLELVPVDAWRRQFEVNVIGLVAVTRACIPLLRRGPGRIVNVGSVAGRSALPGSGPYDSTKFAVEAITDVLRMELHPWRIAVSVIEAGAVATAIWEKTLREVDDLCRQTPPERLELYRGLMATLRREASEAGRTAVPAGAVVKAVEHALTARRPRPRYLVGADARMWVLLNCLPTRWRDRLILSKVRE